MRADVVVEMTKLAGMGFRPLPVKPGEKHPYIEWTKYRDRPSWPALAGHFTKDIGFWTVLGSTTGWIVLDCDNQAAYDLWTTRLSVDDLDVAGRVQTRKGWHFYFRVNQPWPGWTWRSDPEAVELDAHYEVLGEGNGVMLPPSRHAEDRSFVYEWVTPPDDAPQAPEALRKPTKGQDGATVTSMLSHSLATLPQEGGRDIWMTKVAGHLASWIPYEDAFVGLLQVINQALPDPLTEEEIGKKVGVWRKEREKTKYRHDEEAGWLVGDGRRLLTECRGGGDAPSYSAEWADFDIKVKGVIDDGDQKTYVVDFFHKNGFIRRGMRVKPAVFGRVSDLTVWLIGQGGTIMPPRTDAYASHGESRRLYRYLLSQKAPAYQAVDHLGWVPGAGFITHEGVLRPGGLSDHEGICPDPKLVNWAKYNYGEVTESEALDVFQQVLSFQDETVTSVFASWWAMAILKGQYKASVFPFFALESGSESGKTNGFFAMMVALSGNQLGHGQSTVAAMRDHVSAHRNGVVWLDDVTDTGGGVADIIRQATSEGSRSKKAGDRHGTEDVKLLSPILVSGEGMGSIMSEKAMRDRAIRMAVPSPIHRKSLVDPNQPQWNDVLALYAKYDGDLTKVAGTLVRQILARATLLTKLPELKTSGGRHEDKAAILRMGAIVLADVTGDEGHIQRVNNWLDDQADEGAINYATREIIPWFLRDNHIPDNAKGHPAAFADPENIVWVSPEKLADAWRKRGGLSDREKVLGDEEAIKKELKALGCVGSKVKIVGDTRAMGGKKEGRRYVELDLVTSRYILDRCGLPS